MNNQEKALKKMLDEMAEEHTDTEDRIHNWLCKQDDQDLFTGILAEQKTIHKAVQFCSDKARALASKGVAMVADDQVYSWIRYYFVEYEEPKVTPEKPVEKAKVVPIPKPKPVVAIPNKVKREDEQLSLLDML